MSKITAKKPITGRKVAAEQYKALIPEKYQDVFYVGLLVVAVFVFFGSAIFGNGFGVSDTIASHSFQKYTANADKNGTFPLWIPYIFSGMPSFGSMLTSGTRLWDFFPVIIFGVIGFVGKVFESDVARIAVYYILYGLGMYLLMLSKKHEKFTAFFTAFAAVFSTCVVIWVMIGHNTKPVVFATFPFIFMLLEKLREKFSLIHSVLLIIILHIMMEGAHLQMIFYGICAFGLYLVFELVSRMIKKENPASVLRAAAVLIVAAGISFAMSSDRYLSTAEYTKYSTRGSAPIVKVNKNATDEKGGNTYDYATMWSFSPGESFTFLVPNFYGFGKLPYSGPETNNQKVMLPAYWGQKPFDDAAPYMGIGVLGLAVLGFILYRKDVFVQFLLALSIFSLLLSFGRNFSILYDLFFNYVPSFNKFRAPSMSLALLQFAVPILAGYGLSGVFKWRQELDDKGKKLLLAGLTGSIAFLVVGFIFSAGFKDSYMSSVANAPDKQIGSYVQKVPAIADFIWSSVTADWYITGLIAVLTAGLIWVYAKGKLQRGLFMPAMAVILLFDLFRVGWRPMEVSEKPIEKEVFNRTDLIDFLEQDKSKFRIADLTQQASPNIWAYWGIESVNGYHSAKLRVYQDLMDNANLENAKGSTSVVYNPFLWNIMNVKYIIADQKLYENVPPLLISQSGKGLIYGNPSMLPRAFFVSKAEVASPLDILKHLAIGDFNPIEKAYVETALPQSIDTITPGTKADVTEYKNEDIKISTTATGNNLLFISEVYYPGWKAYLDGKEVPIFKTNYAFRSVIVPAGNHTLELKLRSENFELGKNLSLFANIFTLLAAIAGVFMMIKDKKSKKAE